MTFKQASTLSRLAPIALAALLPLSAQAHMTWILPNSATASGKEPVVAIDAVVSEDLFNFERGLKLGAIRVTAPNGQTVPTENPVSSRHRESFEVKLTQDGTYRISNVSQSVMASYKVGGETKRFRGSAEGFAKEVPATAEIIGMSVMTNRQQTFVSKEEPGELKFAPEGEGLELLPLNAVTDLSHGDKSKFRLLLDGKPVADAQIKVLRDGNRYRYKLGEVALKTDAQGEFTVEWTEPGRYWIGASAGDRPTQGGPAGTREAPLKRAGLSATFEVLPK